MPSLLKTSLARAARRTGALKLAREVAADPKLPLVLGYHRVVEDFSRAVRNAIPAMLVTSRMLEEHIDWIGRRYEFVSLDDVGASLSGIRQFRKPLAAITFDDGYRDVYEHALPLLRRKGVPAAAFVVTGLMDTNGIQVHDEVYMLLSLALRSIGAPAVTLAGLLQRFDLHTAVPLPEHLMSRTLGDPMDATVLLLTQLEQATLEALIGRLEAALGTTPSDYDGLRSLTWDMVKDMDRAGFTIGSHTQTHVLLPNESPQRVAAELRCSREQLESVLQHEVGHFAYPNGRFDAGSVPLVAESGYHYAYTTCRHRDEVFPHLTIPRKVLWEKSCTGADGKFVPAIMECHSANLLPVYAPCRRDHRRRPNGMQHALSQVQHESFEHS